MKISEVMERSTVIPHLKSGNKKHVIKELADKVCTEYPGINNEKLVELLLEREKLCSTALDSGVAIPHAKLGGISEEIVGFGRSVEGIDFDSLDTNTTHFFILLIAPENSTGRYIELLARISMIFKNPDLRSHLMKAESGEEIYENIISEDEKF